MKTPQIGKKNIQEEIPSPTHHRKKAAIGQTLKEDMHIRKATIDLFLSPAITHLINSHQMNTLASNKLINGKIRPALIQNKAQYRHNKVITKDAAAA